MLNALLNKLPGFDVVRLKTQFQAWWEGYELEGGDQGDEGAPESEDEAALTKSSYKPQEPELAAHLTIAQHLWGHGFVGPGGPSFIMELIHQLAITRDFNLAYVGSGLGGPAREISKETGVWISAFEARPDLVEVAQEQSHMAGLTRKVVTEQLDFSKDEPLIPPGKFNVIISREEISHIADKETALKQIAAGLRSGGSFLFTDYVILDEEARADVQANAFSDVWGQVDLWTSGQYTKLLSSEGLDVRVKKDISETYIDFIGQSSAGWGEVMSLAKAEEHDHYDRHMFLMALAQEAAVWAERLEALKSKKIAVFRYLAMKP